MNKKFLLTIVLPLSISIVLGILIVVLNSTSVLNTRVSATIAVEKNTMSDEIDTLVDKIKDLEYAAADYDKALEENKMQVDEIQSLTAELESYIANIENAKTTITELDTSIENKTKYNNSLKGIKEPTSGTTTTYKNEKLNVPSNLPAGRYKAQGTGTIMIYSIAGTLEDKQDLSLLDTHSYTFNVSSGQSVKIEGTLSLTNVSE